VNLVNDRIGVTVAGPFVLPQIFVIEDDAARYVPGRIERARSVRVIRPVPEHVGLIPDLADERASVGIEQQLLAVEAEARAGIICSAGPISVPLPDADARDECVPNSRVVVHQRDTYLAARRIEQAELDAVRRS